MDTLLVDTSTVVNFLKGHSTSATDYLKNNISNILIATCPVIVQEVLQGIIAESTFKNTKSFFDEMVQFRGEQYELAIEAAVLYRKLRNVGITVRKPNDCLIAIYAIKHNVALLHDDRDFDFIAKHSNLKIISFN